MKNITTMLTSAVVAIVTAIEHFQCLRVLGRMFNAFLYRKGMNEGHATWASVQEAYDWVDKLPLGKLYLSSHWQFWVIWGAMLVAMLAAIWVLYCAWTHTKMAKYIRRRRRQNRASE